MCARERFPQFTRFKRIACLVSPLFGLLTVGAGEPSAAQLAIRRWQMEDGRPQNSVNCGLQTREGYLWIAT